MLATLTRSCYPRDMPTDDLAEAIAMLRQKRAAHMEQVQRIDAALAALTVVIEKPGQSESALRGTPRKAGSRTTRQKLVALLEEGDRDWSVREVIDEYVNRGDPFTGANPDSAIRAAIVTAVEKDEIFRCDLGRYKSTRFKPVAHDPGSNGHSSQEVVSFSPPQD